MPSIRPLSLLLRTNPLQVTTFALQTQTLTKEYPLLISETRKTRIVCRRAGLSAQLYRSRCPSSSITQGQQAFTIGACQTTALAWTARTLHTTILATMISLAASETIASGFTQGIAFLPSHTEKSITGKSTIENSCFRVAILYRGTLPFSFVMLD